MMLKIRPVSLMLDQLQLWIHLSYKRQW